jgi:hypothetical protein
VLVAAVVIAPAIRIVALHLILSDLFEREFDEVKLVKRMALAVAAVVACILVIIAIEMHQ